MSEKAKDIEAAIDEVNSATGPDGKLELLKMADELGVTLAHRETIAAIKHKLVTVLTADMPKPEPSDTRGLEKDPNTPDYERENLPPPNKIGGRLPKGYRGTSRRLKNRLTGRIFVYTDALSTHPDMDEIEPEKPAEAPKPKAKAKAKATAETSDE